MTVQFFKPTYKNRFNGSAMRTRASVAKSLIELHYSPCPRSSDFAMTRVNPAVLIG